MYVCLYVCELNVCVYYFIMLQYVKVSCAFCFWQWNFVWTALCRLNSCTHHFQTQQQHHHISFNQKKKNLIIPETQLQTKKNVVSKSVISWMLWSFWTEKKKFLCRQLSVFSSWDTCTSFVYILFHGDFSLPAMKFWPLSQLWRRLWAGSDKSYLLSYVEIYIKLNSSGFLCQFEEKSKVTNRMDMETYPTWSPSTTISQTGHPCFDVHHPVLMSTVIYFFL